MAKKRTKSDTLKDALLKALEKNLGNVSKACKAVDCARDTFYRYMKEDEEFAQAVEDLENVALDFAESALMVNIGKGKETSIIFFLKTKGKHRGYVEKIQTEDISDREPVQVEIIAPNPRNEDQSDDKPAKD